MSAAESTRAATRWVTRSIPVILAAAIGYATYVVVVRICSEYLIGSPRRQVDAAIAILVLYFILLLLTIATYLRTILTVNIDPGLVPLGPLAAERQRIDKDKPNRPSHGDTFESRAYYSGPDMNPDSPGLEEFYSKSVFVCESDGRPKWCSECCNWKADRVHHSSEIERCVLRMDHFCPWVGGMIGETSFKFFVQFTFYACAFCGLVLGAAGWVLQTQINGGLEVDPHIIATVILGGFFGLFTFLMTITSLRYVSLNMTNVDMLGASSKVYQLAVRIPRNSSNPTTPSFATVTYPLPKLQLGINGEANGPPRRQATTQNGANTELMPERFATRDELAQRTFAILRTEAGENPWHLGYWKNWKAVMGNNIFDWFFPVNKSPCVQHDSNDSFYPFGPILDDVCARYGITNPIGHDVSGVEMQEVTTSRA